MSVEIGHATVVIGRRPRGITSLGRILVKLGRPSPVTVTLNPVELDESEAS